MEIRLPRFHRALDSISAMRLTSRDAEVVQLVSQHRFLRSGQIHALIAGSRQPLLRRLQLLFHHGYLDRPRAQLANFHQGGSRSMVYGLGNQGAKLLAAVSAGEVAIARSPWKFPFIRLRPMPRPA